MTALAALAGTLRELAAAIAPLTGAAYCRRDLRASGSIGAHVRHCLDHVCALERGMAIGEVCYDHRERETVVEHDVQLAVSRLRRAVARLEALDARVLDRPLRLRAQLTASGCTVELPTTVGREVAFVISHTVHHNALIAVLLEGAELDVPARFGLAPTSPEVACAR